MKFTCTKENLSRALDAVSAVANKQANLPILLNVLFVVTESKVELITTNLEVAVRVQLRAKIDTTGSFTVPAKTLSDYVHLLSGEQVHIELQENQLLVTSGTSSTKIKGTSADDFPVVPDIEEQHAYVIEVSTFREALAKAVVAVAKNEIRPELSGVYFGFCTERFAGLLLAATDSYRLAEKQVTLLQGGDEVTCIVSGRTVYELMRLLSVAKEDGGETQVRLWVSENQIAMRFNTVEMTARLVDGQYPDYSQIIPTDFTTTTTLPIDVLVNKIKAASLFTTTGVNAVSFDLNVSDNTVGISSTSTQTGEHSSVIDTQVEGEENSILLNHRYVLDGLGHMSGDVVFKMNGGDAPCLFQEKGQEDYLYIVMPIRQ